MKRVPMLLLTAAAMLLAVMCIEGGAGGLFAPDAGKKGILSRIGQGKALPVRLLNPESASGILQGEDVRAFSHAGRKTVKTLVILCPGHRDYVKNTINLLERDENWNKADPEETAGAVKEKKSVPVRLLEKGSAAALLNGDAAIVTSARVDSCIKGRPLVILCPGHSDYVKNSTALLSSRSDWIIVE